ncbi:MAG: S41 family peptidase [bacterium]
MKQFKNRAAFIPAAIAAFLIYGFVVIESDIYFRITKSIDIYGRIFKEVSSNYVDRLNPEEFMLAGIKGMLSSLDPYTVFIDEELQKDVDIITKGKYNGIGASVGIQNDKVTIIDLIEGYSAQRQGMRIGDVIFEIDGVPMSRDNYSELSKYLKRDAGTEISVTVEREGVEEKILFNLVCEEVEIKNITYYGFVPESSNNVYIKLSGFSRSAGEEIKKALIELSAQKEVQSIILDLRGNPGGLLDAAIDVSEKFLKTGQLIVSVIGRDTTDISRYFSTEEPITGKNKLAVLVDHGSASASEIVAGAIQDHDRGILLGTNSFGKGLVQTVIPLSYNTSLKITTSRYYTPSGRCIQRINYGDENKVFEDTTIFVGSEYFTDNNRIVYSAGGILPDSVVDNDSESRQVKQLLAKGMFFKFASFYFNTHENFNWKNVTEQDLFNSFLKYLSDNKFQYTSRSEKLLNDLKEEAEKENYNLGIKENLTHLLTVFQDEKDKELLKYKNDIIREIRKEIAAHTEGRGGRIIESLKYDKQFETALSILKNDSMYKKLLNISE